MSSQQRQWMGEQVAIYLASRFARRDEMREIAGQLENEGFLVTSRWLHSPLPISSAELANPGEAAKLAQMDIEDVMAAGVCIAFTEPADNPKPGRGGRHTEFGLALASGAKVILVGPREHIFHCLPGVEQFDAWDAALGRLVSDDGLRQPQPREPRAAA